MAASCENQLEHGFCARKRHEANKPARADCTSGEADLGRDEGSGGGGIGTQVWRAAKTNTICTVSWLTTAMEMPSINTYITQDVAIAVLPTCSCCGLRCRGRSHA